tara:strand:- start:942 stop:1214 length:273 start_codon:yes stop_codon:yes gene_type:complete
MLNTTQVKQLVKQRFGDYAKCYVNKCKYNNKRNLAFVMQTDLTEAELQALATEVGCTTVKQTGTHYDYGYKQLSNAYKNFYLRFVHVDFN